MRPKDAFWSIAESLKGVDASAVLARLNEVYRLNGIDSPGVFPEHLAVAVLRACGMDFLAGILQGSRNKMNRSV